MPKIEKGKRCLACSCGYTSKSTMSMKEEIKNKDIEVMESQENVLPKVEIMCPKCKHNEAYWWEQQIRAADEPATRFFKCCKCEHTWRDLKSG